MNQLEFFHGEMASPSAILNNRSDRVARQRALLQGGGECIVSFTLNIPGPMKRFPLAHSAFCEGIDHLRRCFAQDIMGEQLTDGITGYEAILSLGCAAEVAKLRTIALEDTHPLGRLFDMDVLDKRAVALSRTTLGRPPRACLLCGQDAKLCGRSRAHSLETLQLGIANMLYDYFRDRAAHTCAAVLTRALLYEVSVTPKPGLVDRMNAGAHQDMDFFTFLDSSTALSPHFAALFRVGWDGWRCSKRELFSRLRFAGRNAEADMFRATGNVNTHKGMIFSFGLLCGALGAAQPTILHPVSLVDLLAGAQAFGALAMEDFSVQTWDTPGGRCYSAHRVPGARGEACQGFSSAVNIGLPGLELRLNQGYSLNAAAAITLIALLANVDDTNMIHRGGIVLAKKYQAFAAQLLPTLNESNYCSELEALDKKMCMDGLSPGGCADILAFSLALLLLKQSGLVV